jgi:hypothetical protein
MLGSCAHAHMIESYLNHNALLIAIVNKLQFIFTVIIIIIIIVIMDRT